MKTRHLLTLWIGTILTLWSAAPAWTQQSRTAARAPNPVVRPGPDVTWTLAAVGDAIITRRIAQFDHPGDPGFQRLAEIIRGADAAFLNLELSFFRLSEFKGWPEVEQGGNWELGLPEAALDLKAVGFDLFNRANNHTTDYGVEGMRMTNKLLNELQIVHAGSGETLGEASRPGYFETPKGRVALIGLASTFTPMSRAGASRPDMRGRPGLNGLRIERRYEADGATFETLKALAQRSGGRLPEQEDEPLRIFGATVYRGPQMRVVERVNPSDEARILREIRNASKLADFVIVTSHTHESGRTNQEPPDWYREWTKKCIDAGAVAYVGHGPHVLRGIEIYKGRPIFYSLANFVFQNETIDPMPSDNYEVYALPDSALASDLYDARFRGGTIGFPTNSIYYESVVALPTFQGQRLVELKLYPIDMARTAPRSQRGTPRMADEATGRKIIERLAQLSEPFGTRIVYENGIGVWRASGAATSSQR
ncbi:MAG: CapA family protein [Gemmatimonadetes bacterium]|nr:CapA family protein [Gemmatimonadota bacterium]